MFICLFIYFYLTFHSQSISFLVSRFFFFFFSFSPHLLTRPGPSCPSCLLSLFCFHISSLPPSFLHSFIHSFIHSLASQGVGYTSTYRYIQALGLGKPKTQKSNPTMPNQPFHLILWNEPKKMNIPCISWHPWHAQIISKYRNEAW